MDERKTREDGAACGVIAGVERRLNSPLRTWTWDWQVREQRSPPCCLLQFKVGLEGGFAGVKPSASRRKPQQNSKVKQNVLHCNTEKTAHAHMRGKFQFGCFYSSGELKRKGKQLKVSPVFVPHTAWRHQQHKGTSGRRANLLMQSFLFQWSLKPGRQEHSNPPTAFTHPCSQPPLFRLHSFISARRRRVQDTAWNPAAS